MAARAFITGLAGTELLADERAFLREARPWAGILFKRNIQSPEQVIRLVGEFREAVGHPRAPMLIDQEGGRVQRLGPPHWPVYPPGAAYGALYDSDPQAGLNAARLGARLIAFDLMALGIDVDCAPIADLPVDGGHDIIGNRAYGKTVDKVAHIAVAFAQGLLAGGVLPVLKHLPGHGRALADSHISLPTVETPRQELEATDFATFRPLAGLPLGMTAHVVYTAIDRLDPATTSVTMVQQVIRESIGFRGALMSDDVSMGALSGSIAERSRASIKAGCDLVLHCNGDLREMQQVAFEAPWLEGVALQRTNAALAARRAPEDLDVPAARAAFAAMLGEGSLEGTVS
jgi:beta-N-acetylhexosaminidase